MRPAELTEHHAEAERLMTICNACRYCEGLCAVFPAMEMRRSFAAGDLDYLANLCHSCGACYVDCQFSPPHEFEVNVPRVLAEVRARSYRDHAWPGFMRPLFDRNGLAISVAVALCVTAFILGFVVWHDPSMLFEAYRNPGSFYALMPHSAMAALFGAAALFAAVALAMGFRSFWRAAREQIPEAVGSAAVLQALRDAGELRYLDGGGVGCYNADERPTDRRRFWHHLTFYGFLLCFAATSSATLMHYILDMPAPYPWYAPPKIMGTIGGIGLVAGPLGLFFARRRRDPMLLASASSAMDNAFIFMFFATGLTGLLLMLLRQTPAMGILLALHLGVVLALFMTMPYGKFVHGIFRYAALMLYAVERRRAHVPEAA
ncbi:tricarballylate utilization 4Fe-4S protein TcuB [Sphingomonadaceae bacterium G21617-S1]|jgi:citrate/tricarballylate utilization protein|nr:tricarballylate utilization 4Fe-4S protein TcuB [Sphingomonadaceae bacterium G21617-S1]